MQIPFCPECFSKLVIKNRVKERKLYFYHERVVNNISEIVEENSNFTHDFKSKCLELVGLFFGSVRNIAYKFKKKHGSQYFTSNN